MSLAVDIASWFLLVVGSLFCLIGGVGLLRLPDFYSRMHAAGITDTLGALLVLLGLLLLAGFSLAGAKILFILAFLWMASPTATHALAKAASHGGVHPALPASSRTEDSSSAR